MAISQAPALKESAKERGHFIWDALIANMLIVSSLQRLRDCSLDCSLEQALEFPREIDRDASVYRPLLVEEAIRPAKAEYAFVPNVGVNV